MSENIEDGGPAFPCEGGVNSGLYAAPGMSLRDWFAGQALTAINSYWSDEETRETFARNAYQMADAMIKARAFPNSEEEIKYNQDTLPCDHMVLEQTHMLDGRISQTVQKADGSEYERIVSAEEAYGSEG
jgi:hypothetical protein